MRKTIIVMMTLVLSLILTIFMSIHSHSGEEFDKENEQNPKESVIVQYKDSNIKEIGVDRQGEVQPLLEKLENQDDVLYAEENVPIHIHGNRPNDTHFSDQWYLESIHAMDAWESTDVTETKVTVAVIDSGIDTNHPDLQGNVMSGYNFIANNADTEDQHGHGTAVSGIIAALYNNQIGIVGVSGQAQVEILPLKVTGADGIGSISDMIRAVDYAVDHNVDVINISMGASSFSGILEASIQKAIDQDILVISSAGNKGNTTYSYPASYESVVSVGSVSVTNTHSDFSNYNDRVDVVTPGESIISTGLNHAYPFHRGTSFSSAILSGMAAYIKASYPHISSNELTALIKESATDLGTEGRDDKFGHGLINFEKAVSIEHERIIPITAISFKEVH